ncbi:outer membrane protein assembly factor BamA, partial [Bdellovibrionota bacterium FG-2]
TIGAVQIKGLKRIEKDAITVKLVSKSGEPLTREKIRSDIEAIFQMGFFDDIAVEGGPVAGNVAGDKVDLTYTVKERPAISKIEFDGNERITTNDLREVLKVKEWAIFDVNKVKDDVARIQKHYEDKGFYLAKVNYEVKSTKPDEVELTYKINDYDKVQIKKITFLNNKVFSDEQLKVIFAETKEGSVFSALSNSGNFKESAFTKSDLQRLSLWYFDHGYLKFRYDTPVVTVSDDKRWLYITVYVDEGDQYRMGALDFSGDLLFTKDELKAEVSLRNGDVFSISRRNADMQKLTEKYEDLGYAFVNVIPKFNFHDDTKIVDLEYGFEKGQLVHFGEINVLGNSKTWDKVIRRELRINEGELYSGSKLRISRENVERLGYFAPGEVVFNKITPKGRPEILNVEISVKERSTGTITLGAGYGSVQGFFFTTTVGEINLLGRGQNLSLAAQYAASSESKSLNLGFTDPYAFDTRWSMGFDIYSVVFPIPNRYTTRKLGFDVRLGYPLGDYVNGYITYKNEGMQIYGEKEGVSIESIDADRGVLSSVVWSVVRDKRNNRFEPTDGNFQSASFETAGIGGDKHFLKWILSNRIYHKVWGDLVFRNNIETGRVSQWGDHPIPPAEMFLLGGPNNMKGYGFFLLGPTVNYNGRLIPTGGAFESFSLFELEYPLIREAGLKWVVFYDIGNAWDSVPGLSNLTVRSDAGFGIRWFSPIGPLRFEWGFPFRARPGEESPVFQFFIGPPF